MTARGTVLLALCLWAWPGWAAGGTGPLKTGEYALEKVQLAEEWQESCGYASPPETAVQPSELRELEGVLYRSARAIQVRVWVTQSGKAPRALLAIDANGNGQTDDDPVVAGKLLSGTEKTAQTFEFRPKSPKVYQDARLVLTLQKGGVYGQFRATTSAAVRARVPRQSGSCDVYAAPCHESLWLDENGDGKRQSCELPGNSKYLGIAGELREVTSDATWTKLTVAPVPGQTTRVSCDFVDARGKPAAFTMLNGYLPTVGRVWFIRPSGTLVMAVDPERGGGRYGSATVDLGGGREMSLSLADFPATSPVGKARKIGGRMQANAECTVSKGGRIEVTAAPGTNWGQKLSGFSGTGESGGKVKVYSAKGELVHTGALEFG
ncbi:hypothetical protein LLH03_21060 [bacterium]|nr:hypothetical protein [bacterium]